MKAVDWGFMFQFLQKSVKKVYLKNTLRSLKKSDKFIAKCFLSGDIFGVRFNFIPCVKVGINYFCVWKYELLNLSI